MNEVPKVTDPGGVVEPSLTMSKSTGTGAGLPKPGPAPWIRRGYFAGRLLIVLDDVWEPEATDPFTGLGAGCRLLITTRNNQVPTRARADRYQLHLLEPAAARSFLAEAAGIALDSLPSEADAIVRQCGRLRLALAAVAALIQSRSYTWADALAALEEEALDELDTNWLPDPEHRSLTVVLKLSVDTLSDVERGCFFDCAAFLEDVDIPEAVLLRLWSVKVPAERAARRLAGTLVDRSVMHRNEGFADGRPRYRIHDLYMDYLRHAAKPLPERHRHLIKGIGKSRN